jgi:extracellular factor (EF) 3-hydroxypalmitic acid methyl ester biosynthesis protein
MTENGLVSNHSSQECVVTCLGSQGVQVHASCARLTRHAAVFEVYGPSSTLLASEVLNEFKISLRGRTVFSGKAVVKRLVSTGLKEVCEAELGEGWLDFDGFAALADKSRLSEEFRSYIAGWQKQYTVRPEFKLHIADMQIFFIELRQWLDQVEMGVRAAAADNLADIEHDITGQLASCVIPTVDGLFEKFEMLAGTLEEEQRPLHRAYMKRQLHPLLLCSPFAHRTFTKPLGFAGDYEMVNMIWRNGHEGSSLFAKVVNCWFLEQPPARAHRNRIDYLVKRLIEETLRVRAQGRPARVFNLACGPALEVQEFLRASALSSETEIALLDFNQETLDYTSAILEDAKRRHARSTVLHFIKKSVHQILKESVKASGRAAEVQYDFIYCAGLFDYLSDAVCQRLTTTLYRWLAPGGLLLLTNVDACNPLRQGMDYLLDWSLIHRTTRQCLSALPGGASPDMMSVRADTTGVNLLIEVRKPEHA